MGNIVCFNCTSPVEDWISMSNGLMNVFINVLSLSGSKLAETIDEKRLVVWLSEKDQKIGLGVVGFDVVDMPWNKTTFTENKDFILRVINAAENKIDWEKLDYVPNEELLFPRLQKFREYIKRMSETDVQEKSLSEWLNAAENDDPINCGFPHCHKHDTLLTLLGCQICNN